MDKLRGLSVSPGIGTAKVFLFSDVSYDIPRYAIAPDQAETEIGRYETAVEETLQDLYRLQKKSAGNLIREELDLLDAHTAMLKDPGFQDRVHHGIREELRNAEAVLSDTAENLIRKLREVQNTYLRERARDVEDMYHKIMLHLLRLERPSLTDLPYDCIVTAPDLLPSDILRMDRKKVKGLILEKGGKTSHASILARAFEIPALIHVENASKILRNEKEIILHAPRRHRGLIIQEPDRTMRQTYRRLQERFEQHKQAMLHEYNKVCTTKDGTHICLMGNMELPEEADGLVKSPAEGVGLMRTEFLLMRYGNHLSEDEQFLLYKTLLEKFNPREVTFRTFDWGGDKVEPPEHGGEEANPLLGWRAIRFCLARKEYFRTQMRALFRSSVYGRCKILVPLISGYGELEETLAFFREIREELRREGVPFNPNTPVGIMMEVPSAVLTLKDMIKQIDFFSIGTNDLIQYTIGVDRGNEQVAHLYDQFHPGFLRLIREMIRVSEETETPCGICGEMAGDPLTIPLLLGLGLRQFSIAPSRLAVINRMIRHIRLDEAAETAREVMQLKTGREINEYMNRRWGSLLEPLDND